MPKKHGKRKKFNGGSFTYYDSHRTRPAANRTAEALRKQGWLVRITKVSEKVSFYPWLVWRRKK